MNWGRELGLEPTVHRERPEDLGLFSLKKSSIQGELVTICYWKRAGLLGDGCCNMENSGLIKGNNCCPEVEQVLKGRGNLYPAGTFRHSNLLAAHPFFSPTLIIPI